MMEQLLVHIGLVDQVTKPLQSISNEVKSTLATVEQCMESITIGDKGVGTLGLLTGVLKELKSTAIALSNNYKEGVKVFDAIKDIKFTQGTLDSTNIATKILTPWQQFQAELIAVRDSISKDASDSVSSVVDPLAGIMSKGLKDVVSWTKEVPLLGDAIHYAAVAGSSGDLILNGLVSAIDSAEKVSGKWSSSMEKMTKVSTFFREQTELSTVASWLFNSALWANPVTWIIVGIIALGVAVAGIIYYWDDLSEVMTNAVVGIMDYWDKFLAKLNSIWIFRKIGELFSWIGSVVMMVINIQIKAWSLLFNFIGSVFSSIAGVVISVMDNAISAWQSFSDALLNTVYVQSIISAFNTIYDFVSGVFNQLVSVATTAWELIKSGVGFLMSAFGAVKTVVGAFFTLLVDGPAAAFAALGDMKDSFTEVITSVQNGWQLMKDGFTGVFDALSDLSVFELIGDSIDWLLDKLSFFGIDVEANVKSPAELKAAEQNVEMTRQLKPLSNLSKASIKADYQVMEAAELKAAEQNVETTRQLKPLSNLPKASIKADYQVMEAAKLPQKATNVVPLKSNLMAYKQPQNQTKLPQNMIQNATTNNKQQSSNNRTYGDITINAQQPFTPDMLAQWEELNAG